MITKDKVTEIFCIIDEFDKNLDGELKKNLCLSVHNGSGKCYINRKGRLSESEMITILICYCSRHRSIHNFIMNLCSALIAYCFFDNKTEVLPVYIEKSKQLELFVY